MLNKCRNCDGDDSSAHKCSPATALVLPPPLLRGEGSVTGSHAATGPTSSPKCRHLMQTGQSECSICWAPVIGPEVVMWLKCGPHGPFLGFWELELRKRVLPLLLKTTQLRAQSYSSRGSSPGIKLLLFERSSAHTQKGEGWKKKRE